MTSHANNALTAGGKRLAFRMLRFQALIASLLVVVFTVLYGSQGTLTALAGAMTSLVPSTVFALYAFRFGGARAASQVVQSLYAGEALKMVLTVVLFATSFLLLNGPWLPLFAVYIVVILLPWLAPVLNLKIN